MWKFNPVLIETIWGGDRIVPYKGITHDGGKVGESWELSGIPGAESTVVAGPDEGMTLTALVEKYGSNLMGERIYKRYGNRFPLLIKLIDAQQDLSVQVHPDENLATELGMPSGKTEMWYVIDALPGARIGAGFNGEIDQNDYETLVESGEIEGKLRFIPVHKGDTFYIPAGRIHTIGAGIMIAEIQQASTTTFRLYDYHRKDANGKERELHTEMAKRAIHFDDLEDPKVKYTPREDLPVNLIRSPFFTANLLKISDVVMRDYSELDTFVAIMALEGSAVLNCTSLLTRDAGNPLISTLRIQAGETALISARALGLEITPEGNFTALEALGI